MVASILAVAAALVGVLIWWIKRRAAVADDPAEELKRREAEYERAILEGDEQGVNAAVAADLDRLRRAKTVRGDPGGPGDQAGGGK